MAGQRWVRLAARTTAISTTTARMHDVGGIERVDVEVGTSAKIRNCIKDLLGEGPFIAYQLRGGAASSPMRRFYIQIQRAAPPARESRIQVGKAAVPLSAVRGTLVLSRSLGSRVPSL